MKKSLLILMSLLCLNSAYALSDAECRDVYNNAFEDLVSASLDFNQGYSDKFQFSAQVAEISTKVSTVRAICMAVESPRNKNCVQAYKKRYKTLRKEIKVLSVLTGNQTEVKPRILQSISNEFSSLFNRIKCGDL
ncbi:hypothetical protein BIY24_10045 [Halobacteriovorax marinus]|uniref:hypothetical protein n=1 Tax=Halobacteriovorax marinus TaxID=97084 RepID=UPI000BC32488|nr:hypothetical protein [Halobacteriovorax marinus]ATH08275.1 hypothetical protein BIY24_10045 [Halobacteriovorax marinus]